MTSPVVEIAYFLFFESNIDLDTWMLFPQGINLVRNTNHFKSLVRHRSFEFTVAKFSGQGFGYYCDCQDESCHSIFLLSFPA